MFFYTNRFKRDSFSQCGEDCIVSFLFNSRGVSKPTYLDIGAYHPFSLSNTAKFYLSGSRGVNIEPNPNQYKYFKWFRRKDINLNLGVGEENGITAYYQMDDATMNTFDKDAAYDLVKNHGFKIKRELKLPVSNLKTILQQHCNNQFPDFLSLDVEGLDEMILQQIDYTTNCPKIICVETVEYTRDGTGGKNQKIINFLTESGYFLYADTHVNSIFVHNGFWFEKK